jgi:hypothetical protein
LSTAGDIWQALAANMAIAATRIRKRGIDFSSSNKGDRSHCTRRQAFLVGDEAAVAVCAQKLGAKQRRAKAREKSKPHGQCSITLVIERYRAPLRPNNAARYRTRGMLESMRLIVCLTVAFGLWLSDASRALARPGTLLLPSIAVARAAKVPLAVFVVRHGKVVAEEWHSYTTPTQEQGPAWTVEQAHRLRVTLMGGASLPTQRERKVGWASFPVWCFLYPRDLWAIYESKRTTDRVWGILAVVSWYWSDSLSTSFVELEDCEGWKLVNGRLQALAHRTLVPPRPTRLPKAKASPTFPSLFL